METEANLMLWKPILIVVELHFLNKGGGLI